MGPIDYSGAFAPQAQNPFAGALQAIQLGATIRDDRAQQAALAEKNRQAQEMSAALSEASQNPTPERIAALSVRYPQLSEGFKRSYDMMASEAQKSNLSSMTQVYAAVNSDRPEIATQLLRQQAETLKSSGRDKEAQAASTMADLVEKSPQHAKLTIGAALSGIMGPDKFAESFAKLGGEARAQEQAPAVLEEARAKAAKTASEAKTAAVTAQYADSNAIQDLVKKKWDVTKIVEDIGIAKETNRIKAMEAAIAKEGNDIKKQEVTAKLEEARRNRDEKIRETVAGAESAASNADNMLNTIERIKKNPALNDVLGSIQGRLPSVFSDEGSNAIELIDTLGSQSFLAQVGQIKGMGALSNAEGEKLQSALTNLSRKQGEKQFRENLDEAARLIKKGRENISKRTGVPLGAPDTPAAPGARKPLSAFDSGAVTLDPRSGVPTLPGP